MGGIFSIIKSNVEKIAFPAPSLSSYSMHHPRLVMINHGKIACMMYESEIKSEVCQLPITRRKLILYSHGNGSDMGGFDHFLSTLVQELKDVDIVAYDYPGYGLSPGIPSEQGCVDAIDTVYQYLIKKGYMSHNILLYGMSIGTGPTISLAVKYSGSKFIGCILQSPYTTVIGVASSVAEYTCSYANIFKTIDIIDQVTTPVTLIHGMKDTIIPHRHAIALDKCLKKAQKPSELISIPAAGHNDIITNHYDVCVSCLKKCLSTH